MKKTNVVGFMIYAAEGTERSVFTDDKYKLLAEYFVESGTNVETILYNNTKAERLREQLRRLDALLVWVNPIEQGEDRSMLDQLLIELHANGVMISTHPDTIMQLGTKRVLFDTRDMQWGSDVELYTTFQDFQERFLQSLKRSNTRVLKQYRGDGGNGVFKVHFEDSSMNRIKILHAKRNSTEETITTEAFFTSFKGYFDHGNPLINQDWNDHITNGIVRCYMTSDMVVGFGYQEINALYPGEHGGVIPPGKRYYFTENCALFSDLRQFMESTWIRELAHRFKLSKNDLPIIWDADFFINEVHTSSERTYSLCEMNVSCVSPFPESAIPKIYAEIERRLSHFS